MSQLRITDHALLRYLERIEGIDIEGFRSQLEEKVCNAPRMRDTIAFASDVDCKLRIDGITYCLRSGVVATCYPE